MASYIAAEARAKCGKQQVISPFGSEQAASQPHVSRPCGSWETCWPVPGLSSPNATRQYVLDYPSAG